MLGLLQASRDETGLGHIPHSLGLRLSLRPPSLVPSASPHPWKGIHSRLEATSSIPVGILPSWNFRLERESGRGNPDRKAGQRSTFKIYNLAPINQPTYLPSLWAIPPNLDFLSSVSFSL